jgi:chemotaxis protein methyltransferase CheR
MNDDKAALPEALFSKFGSLIYEKTGIYLKPEKRELLKARLGKRLRACRVDSFKQYYEYVIHDESGQELIHLINCVSTNFTSFFREKAHFELLTQKVLPGLLEKDRGNREIVVWSAACSSGEEPYTLCMVLADFAEKNRAFRCRVLATDISTKVLDIAKRGIYLDDRVSQVPLPFLKKGFQKGVGSCTGYVKVKESLRNMVTFQRFNLMENFPWREEIDVIFCRNVMIYFNKETQEGLISRFHQALVPGGCLFIGHSESIGGFRHSLKQIEPTVFQK